MKNGKKKKSAEEALRPAVKEAERVLVTIKKRKGFLDDIDAEKELTISAKFGLSSILLKDDHRWRMKLVVWKILPKAYHDYTIKFLVDEEPFEKRIKSVEDKIELVRKEGSLFPENDNREIRNLHGLITDINLELKKLKQQCDVIEFVSEIEEIKYKDGNTHVVMKIPDVVIEPLNQAKLLIGNYKVELLPLF